MSITRKSMIIKLSMLIINLVLVFFLARHFILQRFEEIESTNMRELLQRARYMLGDAVDVFDREAMDYATWNLIHDIAITPLPLYLASDQSDFLFTTLNLNLVIVADEKGLILHAAQFDLEKRVKRLAVDAEILAHFSPSSILVRQTGGKAVLQKGFVRCGDFIMMIAARMLKSTQDGPGKGMIIFGRFLDMNTLKMIERNLGGEIFLPGTRVPGEMHHEAYEKEIATHIARGEKVWADDHGDVVAGFTMSDVYGKDAFMVAAKRPRVLYQMGMQNFRWFIGIAFSAFMLLAVVNLQFLRIIVLRRMTRLSRQVSELAEHEAIEGRIVADDARDEITDLARCINNLIDSRQNLLNKIRKQQQEQTHLAKKLALAQMGSGIAHEISNPFATIMAMTHHEIKRIQAGGYTLAQAEAALQLINKTTLRISQIISGMQALVRDGSGDPLKPHPVENLVSEATKICSEVLTRRKVTLLVGLPAGELTFRCRAIEIVQVLVNLISNAKDALVETPAPWIRIQAEKKGDLLRISVANNGPRIPQELTEKIMAPFFSTKEVGKGSGLGLSISQKIVEEHHGRLFLDQQDKDTCFVLEFSCSESDMNSETDDPVKAGVDDLLIG